MLKTVEGIYKKGKIELLENPQEIEESTKVIVTFLKPATAVSLKDRGIDEDQALSLKSRLSRFAEDWDRPDMDGYDEL